MREDEDLTGEELFRSLDEASWTARAKAVERLAGLFSAGRLAGRDRRRAEDAFLEFCCDGEPIVRRLLAECLKTAPTLRRDVALALATDDAEIATPFLVASPALGERELTRVVRSHPGAHRLAIARRTSLPQPVAELLCRCGEDAPVLAVLANDGATIGAGTLRWLIETSGRRPGIREAIARRRLVPIDIGEKPAPSVEPHEGCGAAAL